MIKNYKQYIKESILDKLEGPTETERLEWILHNYFKLDVIPEDVNDFIDYIFSDYDTGVDTSAPGPIYNKLFSNKTNTLLLSILTQRKELILNDNLETVLTKYYGLNMDEVHEIINNEIEKIDWGVSFRRANESLLDKMEGPTKEEVIKSGNLKGILKQGVENNDLELVKIAVENNVDVYSDSQMVLFHAIRHHNSEMILYLLEHKAHLRDENIIGILKLQDIDLFIEVISKHCPTLQLRDDILFYAVTEQNIEAVKYLIEMRLNVNWENNTPLKTAIRKNNYEIVELLVNNGAKITDEILNVARQYTTYIHHYLRMYIKNNK